MIKKIQFVGLTIGPFLFWFWGILMLGMAYPKFLSVSKEVKNLYLGSSINPSAISFVFFYPFVDILFGFLFIKMGLDFRYDFKKRHNLFLVTLSLFMIIYLITGINTLTNFTRLGLVISSTLMTFVISRILCNY